MQIPDNIQAQLPSNKAAKDQDAQLREIVANFVQPQAMQRLDRVYLVNPIKAKQVEQIIISQAQQGKVAPKSITDDQIKQMLEAVTSSVGQNSSVVVGSIDDCNGEGKLVLGRRTDVLEGVKDQGTDELSF